MELSIFRRRLKLFNAFFPMTEAAEQASSDDLEGTRAFPAFSPREATASRYFKINFCIRKCGCNSYHPLHLNNSGAFATTDQYLPHEIIYREQPLKADR